MYFSCVISPVMSFGLWLSCDGIHDGVLWVHADGCVVLGVNNGGLSSWTPHLNGFVGGEGWVFQSYGVETRGVLHTVRAGDEKGVSQIRGSEGVHEVTWTQKNKHQNTKQFFF